MHSFPMKRLAGALLDRLFPAACVLCRAPGTALCDACHRDAIVRMASCCPRCAMPLAHGERSPLCGRCLRRPPAFERTFAAATYDAPLDQLVRGLKYGATLAYAPLLADLLHARIAPTLGGGLASIDLLLPVPLSRERMAARGFNQSIEIARMLARRTRTPVDTDSVLRIHDTAVQASLPFEARRRNVRGAFTVIDRRRPHLAGRSIALVDDVMTTGATLDELAKTLVRAGAGRVVNLVVARTP